MLPRAPSAVLVGAALLSVLWAAPAMAHASGMSGYSGKSGSYCTSCHGGGATPTVTVTGPSTLNAGQTASYTVTITGGPAVVGGFDLSTNNSGVKLAAGTGSKLMNGELTHSSARSFSGGSLSFPFTVTAPSTAGSFTFYAAGLSANGSGTSGDGASTTTRSVTVSGSANAPPTVALSIPANGSALTAPAKISLAATASDPDGTIARVEFFSGTTKLGEDTSSPYTFDLTNVAAGTYAFTARATDNSGAATTSSAVTIVVTSAMPNDAPPTVAITSPKAGDSFSDPASILLSAEAMDPDGTVARVEFYAGGSKIGEDLSSPFEISWSNVPPGTYSVTAVATDDKGATGASTPVNVTVVAVNTDDGESQPGSGTPDTDAGIPADQNGTPGASENPPQVGCTSTAAGPGLMLLGVTLLPLLLRRRRSAQ